MSKLGEAGFITTVRRHGEKGLKLVSLRQVERLSDLRHLLKTNPGREDLRVEIAARVILICEMGFQRIAEIYEEGDDPFDSNVIQRIGTFLNTAERMLHRWPKVAEELKDVSQVLDEMKKDAVDDE